MITEVTKYVVDGGKEFDTIEEAQRHERSVVLAKELSDILYRSHLPFGFTDCGSIAEVIVEHFDVKKRQC